MRGTPLVGSSDGRGSNSVQVRRYNERIVLRELRRCSEASKAELARRANLTSAAVGTIIDELEAYGLIEITGKRHAGGRGQPATLYRLRKGGAYGVGVRLDRSSIETVLMDLTGQVIAQQSHGPTLPEPEKALRIISQDIDMMLEQLPSEDEDEASSGSRVTGIGLAQPYNMGNWLKQLALPSEVFLQWQDYDFRKALEDKSGLPVFAENDGTASAIAELFYGKDPERKSFLYMFIGPAIGGGVILNGDPLYGETANAGDVATMPVPPSRLPSSPKPKGDWDILITRASLNALIRHLDYFDVRAQNRSALETIIEDGHQAVTEWIEDCVDALVPCVYSALAILDVPLLIIDSDLNGGLQLLLKDSLEREMDRRAPEGRDPPRIEVGSFGPDAGAIGAAALPLFINFSPRASILTNSTFSNANPRVAGTVAT